MFDGMYVYLRVHVSYIIIYNSITESSLTPLFLLSLLFVLVIVLHDKSQMHCSKDLPPVTDKYR